MHPFVVPFVVLAVITAGILMFGAWLRAGVCPDKPLAFHALVLWGLIVLLANVGNTVGWRAGTILLSVAVVLLAFVAAWSRIPSPAGVYAALVRQRSDMVFLFGVLTGQAALYVVPLVVIFPPHTLITGNFVCNDSVVHAVMMRGFDIVHREFGAWPYLGYYPDGFHAVVFALSRIFPVQDAPFFLLPVSVWATSFLGLSIVMLLTAERQPHGVAGLLVAVSPAAAFLLSTSVHLYFIAHMAVLPFIIGAIVMLFSWPMEDFRGRAMFLALVPLAAAVAVYGLLSVSLLAFAVAVRAVLALLRGCRPGPIARQLLRVVSEPAAWGGCLAILLLSWPMIVEIYQGFSFFASQTSSWGNLGGFLSPFHVTGFWASGAEYRSQLTGSESFAATILAAVFAVEVYLVATARLSRAAAATLIAFAVPVVASSVVMRNPYINFKYLCMLTAVWVPLTLLGLWRQVVRVRPRGEWLAEAALAGAVILMVAAPVRSFRFLPALPVQWFNTLDAIRAERLARGPVLVLSQEDWFHYYRDADDVMPLTDYFPQTYAGQPMREVLIDTAFQKEAVAFLNDQLGGAGARLDNCQEQIIGGRFAFYEFSCLAGAR